MNEFKVGDIIKDRYLIISLYQTIELFDLYEATTIVMPKCEFEKVKYKDIHSCKDIIKIDYVN